MERCFSINFLIHLTELKWRKFTCKYLRLHAGSIICFKPLPSINWQNLPIIAMSWTHPVTRKLVHPDARLFNYQIIQQQSQHKPALLLFSFYNSFAKKVRFSSLPFMKATEALLSHLRLLNIPGLCFHKLFLRLLLLGNL